ncbi:DUF4270 domain-containing protein [Winogradskyella sp.]|jgi:hypothetical protein|uniref:DUF4270 domain-containing protein n=1 Tax=Winogradskyella sp. TaxID=1883156 RepID=UPI0025D6AC5E|nr:DUF4270 domain-containing protein [Winogradskyella sp.]MCT4629210.1 DUF4270 domain-containing protein [Winogradskyella sp.]
MKKNRIALQLFVFILITVSFIACETEFSSLESDVLNDDVATNFDIKKLSETNPHFTDIITYTKALGPVQTNNNLGLNALGPYDDNYGRLTSSFVSQVTLSSYSPTFLGDADELEIDSVVLTLPYFYRVTEIDTENNITYNVDSIFPDGDTYSPIKLSIYESNYFIRDFDPNAEFNESQAYFSNKSASETEMITALEGSPLNLIESSIDVNHISLNPEGNIKVNQDGFVLTVTTEGENGEEDEVTRTNTPPGIRLKLDPTFWQDKIINQEEQNPTVLSNENNFTEYFRGLYFKAETVNDDGSYIILNTNSTNANITIYYTTSTTTQNDDGEDVTTEEQESFALNFGGNKINFIDNEFNTTIDNGNETEGDARLYLKGGEGSIAKIKLFNGVNPESGDSYFDEFRELFVNLDSDGTFESSKLLVNEANLIFYVDDIALAMENPENQPNRLFLYDIDNKRPLVDYSFDVTNNTLPSSSKLNHLGPLQRVNDEPTGDGIKYKFRVTEHINNLLLRDSTNVELGLSVSLNVNLEELIQQQVQTSDDSDFTSPIGSILSPRGTILHGNNTEDGNKKVYLEIYYTEPNN